MNATSCAVAVGLVLGAATLVSLAEEVTVPLPVLTGYYFYQDARTVGVDVGFAFHEITGAWLDWAGEAAAGYGYQNGIECKVAAVEFRRVFAKNISAKLVPK